MIKVKQALFYYESFNLFNKLSEYKVVNKKLIIKFMNKCVDSS